MIHLVDDDLVALDYRGVPAAFRMRVWRGPDRVPVALASRVAGHIPPRMVSCRLANLAYRGYLAYDRLGLHYLEWDGEQLRSVNFIGWGRDDRLFLTRPEATDLTTADLDLLLGHHVEP